MTVGHASFLNSALLPLTVTTDKVVYKYQQDARLIEAPAPPRAPSEIAPDEDPPVFVETVTTKIIENPTPEDYMGIERGGRSEYRAGGSVSSSRSSSQATARPTGNERTVVAEIVADTPVIIPRRRKSVKSRAKSPKSESSESESKSAMVVSRRKSVRSKDIKAEIRALEAEQRRAEKEEKESKHESRRESRSTEVEKDRGNTVLRVEKDKRGRLNLVRPS